MRHHLLEPALPDGSHVSYVASLWTSMGILVSYNRDGYPHDTSYPAIELASGGFLAVVDLDKVAVLDDPITNNRTVRVVRENPADF